MVHRFLRHGKAKKLLLFSKPRSEGALKLVCCWMGFVFAEVLWHWGRWTPTEARGAAVPLRRREVKAGNKLRPDLKCVAGFQAAGLAGPALQKSGPSEAVDYSGKRYRWMGSFSGGARFHCPDRVLVFAVSPALLWKTICKISEGKCNPRVEWRVLWNEWGDNPFVVCYKCTLFLHYLSMRIDCSLSRQIHCSTLSPVRQTRVAGGRAASERPQVGGLQKRWFLLHFKNPAGVMIFGACDVRSLGWSLAKRRGSRFTKRPEGFSCRPRPWFPIKTGREICLNCF